MTTNVEPIKITGLERDPLRGRAMRLMAGALAKLAVAPVKGQAAFFDDNGPKGGLAMRCALTVRLPFRPSIRVERTAETPGSPSTRPSPSSSVSSSSTASVIATASGTPRSTSRRVDCWPRRRRPDRSGPGADSGDLSWICTPD